MTNELHTEQVPSGEERRAAEELDIEATMSVTVNFAVGTDEVELDGTVVRASAHTVVVELASGAGTLALAVAPRCELLLRAPGMEIRANARPGRRLDDVPGSRQIELVVLDETLDLRDALSA